MTQTIVAPEGKSVLLKEALSLFDQGLQVFLSDPATKKAIGRHSEYDPVLDREYLLQMCQENPEANLEIAVQQDEGVIVLGVGVGPWLESGEGSFKALWGKYGEPDTLAFTMPTGEKHYFFTSDCAPLKLERESGLRWDMGTNAYPVYPSTVEGKPIEKIGTAASIQSLSAWLAGSARAEETNQNTVAEANKVATEATAERHVSAEEVANLQHMGLLDDGPEKSPSADTNHLDTLRKEITSWGAAGSDKAQVLARAIQWNRDNGTPVKTEEVVGLVDELGETDTVAVESLAGEDLLFKLAEQTILFHDGLNDPYFHFEGVPFKAPSKDYEGIIQHRYYARKRQMPKATQLKNVMNILRSKARHEGPQIILKNRVSDKDGAIIYDLCDKRYLTVSKNGWGITPAFPLCQSALKIDPPSASKIDPPQVVVFSS